ncbi:MAG: hypothetical protein U1E87_10035 [Alphaproteobacteria bacterium]
MQHDAVADGDVRRIDALDARQLGLAVDGLHGRASLTPPSTSRTATNSKTWQGVVVLAA